jgi:transposase-like protein
MSKHYPIEQRERAVKMVLDHLGEYRSVYAASQAIGPKVGVGPETLRKWVLQALESTRSVETACRATCSQSMTRSRAGVEEQEP